MAQHDYTIANQGFPATRSDINNVLSAISTNNSGTSAPSTQYAGQFWIDTTASTWTMYIHDGADDIPFATIDTSANTVNFTDSALDVVTDTTPQLGGDLDLNSNDITGTGNINITGNITASGNLTSVGIDDNASANALTIDSSSNLQFNSGFGSVATAYGVRAWVNFNGKSTVSIRASGNVSSITDNGTGDYTVNFTVSMPDTSYASSGSASETLDDTGSYIRMVSPITFATGSHRIITSHTNGTKNDCESVSVEIFR